jgi:hypothetical protein
MAGAFRPPPRAISLHPLPPHYRSPRANSPSPTSPALNPNWSQRSDETAAPQKMPSNRQGRQEKCCDPPRVSSASI